MNTRMLQPIGCGCKLIADEIIKRALDNGIFIHESGIFIHESNELVSLLMQIDLDKRIPPELYRAVAELLAWLYRIEHGQNPATTESSAL